MSIIFLQNYFFSRGQNSNLFECLLFYLCAFILTIFLFQEEIKTKEIKQTIATVSDLTSATLYCIKVQAFSEVYNKSSSYSKEKCIKTPGGRKSFGTVTLLEVKLLTFHKPLQFSPLTYL